MTLRELSELVKIRVENGEQSKLIFCYDENGEAVPLRVCVDQASGVLMLDGWHRAPPER